MQSKVLMVCLGNICRSPLAEGILQQKLDPSKIQVASAGTAGYHVGNPPDPRSIAVALQNGIDIRSQRCAKFSTADFATYDRIYAMDHSNYKNIVHLSSTDAERNKVRLLLDVLADGPEEVPDPYYDSEEGFEKVFHLIQDACTIIAAELSAQN